MAMGYATGELSEREYLSLMQQGLPPTPAPKRVIVVGAGMAGLVAADLLLDAGHEVVILEGRHRVGGRIETIREPFAPGLYGEAGAMRIPRSHALTMAYLDRFGLSTLPFTASNRKAFHYLHGARLCNADVAADPDLLGFDLVEHERGRPIGILWEEAIRPLLTRLETGDPDAWARIVAEYDEFSIRDFLKSQGWSEGCIEMFGLLENQEALMYSSFLELFREEVGSYYRELLQIEGGMDRLPCAFLPRLAPHIRFGAKLTALDQSDDAVTVHYRTRAQRVSLTGDYLILTVPFPVLRHIEVLKPFSRPKQRAIRQLYYDAAGKIFFQCRRRFWEEDEGIVGGRTITDLAIRNIFYPEHGRETGRGVLIASYTWGQDAQRWGSLEPADCLEQALEDLAEIHPQILDTYEVGASKMWHDDEFAGGAFALFAPGQQTLLHDDIIQPEGRVYFAGEHTSLLHAWIQGAIESGLRAALQLHRDALRAWTAVREQVQVVPVPAIVSDASASAAAAPPDETPAETR
jgi:monoamine oxidase